MSLNCYRRLASRNKSDRLKSHDGRGERIQAPVFRPDGDAPNGKRRVSGDGFPHFNGTVVLDWVNVTAQFENAVDSIEAHEMYLREGYAWVGVSAQRIGIEGGPIAEHVRRCGLGSATASPNDVD